MFIEQQYLTNDKFSLKKIVNTYFSLPLSFIVLTIYFLFEYVRPQSIYAGLTGFPWSQSIFILLGLLWITSHSKEIKNNNGLVVVFLLFFVCIASSIFSYYTDHSFERLKVIVNWTFLFLFFIRLVDNKYKYFIFLCLFLLFSFKMSQHAAISWAARGFSFERWGIAGTPGWFGNAADLGAQMLIFFPLSLAFVLAFKKYMRPWQLAIASLMPLTGLLAIVATGQRGTLVGLAGASLITVILQKKSFKMILLIAVIGLAIYQLLPDEFIARFYTIGSDTTSVSRLTYWARGIEFWQENPLLGIGYENWVPYYSSRFPGESLRGPIQEVAHSTPITVLAELGSIGFIIYYYFVFKIYKTCYQLQNNTDSYQVKFLALGLGFGLVAFNIASCFISVAYYPFIWVQAMLVFALKHVYDANLEKAS